MIEVTVITGLSGAGRSHTAGVLEDLGWFVVDNLPPKMILPLVKMMTQPGSTTKRLATVVDVRTKNYFQDLEKVVQKLKKRGIQCRIIFIEASDSELVKRYEKVRRPHPLQSKGGGILEAVQKERELTAKLRKSADAVIDTSSLSIHDLSRKLITAMGRESLRKLHLHIMSFGFKHGVPIDADFMVDMRWLPNPFWREDLREFNGLDEKVSEYVLNSMGAREFLENFTNTVIATFDGFLHENKPNLTVAFGCTGGKHRSVAMAKAFADLISERGYKTSVTNRDIGKE
ncbi:MAG: RNase adapter RapZ [Candidatus Ancillula sp.]|jgi:UPF0042 nucleotide-binding protein|nr:RNase adapter RapZ [Candidatus Ancillula sp.]